MKDNNLANATLARVAAALTAASAGRSGLDPGAVAPLDQFHVGGLQVMQEIGRLLALPPTATVLDVGCGLGGPARLVAEDYGCTVTGIDVNATFIAVATLLSQRLGLADKVTFRVADALALPFPDATFDCVYTQHVAMAIKDRDRLYSGIARVLKPGGQLLIYDPVATGTEQPYFPLPWANTAAESFLLSPSQLQAVLYKQPLRIIQWLDKTAMGLAWFAEQAAAAARAQPSPLHLGLVVGPSFATMAANLRRSLAANRVGLLLALLEKIVA